MKIHDCQLQLELHVTIILGVLVEELTIFVLISTHTKLVPYQTLRLFCCSTVISRFQIQFPKLHQIFKTEIAPVLCEEHLSHEPSNALWTRINQRCLRKNLQNCKCWTSSCNSERYSLFCFNKFLNFILVHSS